MLLWIRNTFLVVVVFVPVEVACWSFFVVVGESDDVIIVVCVDRVAQFIFPGKMKVLLLSLVRIIASLSPLRSIYVVLASWSLNSFSLIWMMSLGSKMDSLIWNPLTNVLPPDWSIMRTIRLFVRMVAWNKGVNVVCTLISAWGEAPNRVVFWRRCVRLWLVKRKFILFEIRVSLVDAG